MIVWQDRGVYYIIYIIVKLDNGRIGDITVWQNSGI